jgi:hypothetical protein
MTGTWMVPLAHRLLSGLRSEVRGRRLQFSYAQVVYGKLTAAERVRSYTSRLMAQSSLGR